MNKILSMFGALALLGLTAGQATASTVTATPGTTVVTGGVSTPVSISIDGNFTEFTSGGTFSVNWEAGLTLDTFSINEAFPTPPGVWLSGSASVGTNSLVIDVASFNGELGLINIATLNFIADLAVGGSANITMVDWNVPPSIQTGWIDFTGAPIAVDYVGGTITAPVPVPAAAWLMLSGLLGLVGVARRKHA
jgi:hypothetical protein